MGATSSKAARTATAIAIAAAAAACARNASTAGAGSQSPETVATTEAANQQSTLAVVGDSAKIVGASIGGTGATGTTGTTSTQAGSRMGSAGDAMGARSDANIVALLHASNVGEIQAGSLAQQRATNQAARSFGQQMVTEHTALDARGNAMATRAGISPTLPDSMLPRQNASDLASLQNASGTAFDRAYMAQQVMAHQRTLALIDASIPMASNAALRTMLQSEVRPRVADHLRMAQQLQTQVGTAP